LNPHSLLYNSEEEVAWISPSIQNPEVNI
jgi:hypothetical protein